MIQYNKDFNKNPYRNREISWLLFEERVLNEAHDESNLLFERLKFLGITSSNLDEFFMIRVAGLADVYHDGTDTRDISGLLPKEQLNMINYFVHELVNKQYRAYKNVLLPKLNDIGINIVKVSELDSEEKAGLDLYFKKNIFPVLTPVAIKKTQPFPLIRNKYIYVGGIIKRPDKDEQLALVQVPSGINRLIEVKTEETQKKYVLLEEIIEANFNTLFRGSEICETSIFRVIRNADLTIDEDDADNLMSIVEREVEKRDSGNAVCIYFEKESSLTVNKILIKELALASDDVYNVDGPLDLTFLAEIYHFEGFDDYKRKPYIPVYPFDLKKEYPILNQIKDSDHLLVHPFESFEPVVRFVEEASVDENVLAIKQTIYRASGNSPIVNALAKAAKNGKQVTVLMELKARFDEENNISIAKQLEKAGCQVIYGFRNLKTHCKITLVIRKEDGEIRQYVHLGTGNYNDTTAKLYTDIGFFTSNELIGEDATNVFNMLSGESEPVSFNKLSLAPLMLRDKFIELIEREAKHAENGRPAHIVAKMNSLCDKAIIDKLYDASRRGVKIDLIVRGICCLYAGVEGISENITVRSIIGNFLEHSRIYYFKNGGKREFYCSSADWMERNMDKRVEILFPVEDSSLKEKLKHVLTLMLKDNHKAWFLQPDGSYMKMPDAAHLYSFQDGFCEEEMESSKINI